jgi:hypothetical protein
MASEQHGLHPDRVDADHALGVDFDAEALELSPGPHSGALSLADETVQLRNVVAAQREPLARRPSTVFQDSS